MITQIERLKRHTKTALCVGVLGTALSSVAVLADLPFTILRNQPYALCAGAIAFVFDEVAYANCAILFGDSASLTTGYPPVQATHQPGGNIATINQQGLASNSFIVSTYSPPAGLTNPAGNLAIYTCFPGSKGSFAQCDGGICFRSTVNTTFPGQGAISSAQIVCSCPVATNRFGYQFFGPYPCLSRQAHDQLCNVSVSNGTTLFIGTPIGGAQFLAQKLNGGFPVKFNECIR
jgi:hypothetical protein